MRPYKDGENLVHLIQQVIPDFAESEYPLFLEFVSTFVRFLENKRETTQMEIFPEYGQASEETQTLAYGGPLYEARKLLDYRDAKTTLDEFTTHFLAMFAKDFPEHQYVSTDTLIRSLRQFYEAEVTDSVKWFFRVLFNEDADVYFPRVDILKASDGTWDAPTTIKVGVPIDGHQNADVYTFYVGQRIVTETGTGLIENVITNTFGQNFNQRLVVNELYLKSDSVLGSFTPGQIVHNIDSVEQVQTVILSTIHDVEVITGGSNYQPGDTVTFSEGPSGGGGYGARGAVKSISSSSINGVDVIFGGDGFITGLPVTFTSTTGSGASAVVDAIVYGDLLLEDGGFFLNESQSADATDFLVLEDKNTLDLELLIDPFVNATSNVVFTDPDYGASAGVPEMAGTNFDSSIEIALAATDSKPFMDPWVFTDGLETTAELANAEVLISLPTNTFFSNDAVVFVIPNALDLTTNVSTSNIHASIIVSDINVGNNQNVLYLKDFAGFDQFAPDTYFKQDGTGAIQMGSVSTIAGTANIVGSGTFFTTTVRPNTHVRIDDTTNVVIRSITNNTLMTAYTALTNTFVANVFSIIPTGHIESITFQAQRFYGKIKTIRLLSNGTKYLTPPAVTVDSISARAQQLFYLDEAFTANAHVVSSANQIDVFEPAVLSAEQNAGQITKVDILDSGVGYTDPDAIQVAAIHLGGRVGDSASLKAIIGAQTQYPGQFTTSQGFLSADKFLQDSTYYNDFTYVVRVAQSFNRYRDIMLQLLHPAGFKLLGSFVLVLEATLDLSSTDLIPVFEPINRDVIVNSDNLALFDDPVFRMAVEMSESTSPARTLDHNFLAQVPEFGLRVAIADYQTSLDYELAQSAYGQSPTLNWSLTDNASVAQSTGTLAANGTYTSVTNVVGDAPVFPFASVNLLSNTSTVKYTFSDANTELFNSRTADSLQFRGTLAIWFRAANTNFAGTPMIFGDDHWLNLRIANTGIVLAYMGNTPLITGLTALNTLEWNLLLLGFRGLAGGSADVYYFQNGLIHGSSAVGVMDFPRSITVGTSNTSVANTARGAYGQACVWIEPVSYDFATNLYAASNRDGAEVAGFRGVGSGVDMIYPWSANSISVLSSNTIGQNYFTIETISKYADQS